MLAKAPPLGRNRGPGYDVAMIQTLTSAIATLAFAWPWAPPPLATDLPYAYACHTCAPWDGPALEIVLQRVPVGPSSTRALPPAAYPRLVIDLWGAPAAGGWIDLHGPSASAGHIAEVRSAHDYRTVDGLVRLTRVTAARIEGEAEVQLRGGPVRTYRFFAPMSPYEAFCG